MNKFNKLAESILNEAAQKAINIVKKSKLSILDPNDKKGKEFLRKWHDSFWYNDKKPAKLFHIKTANNKEGIVGVYYSDEANGFGVDIQIFTTDIKDWTDVKSYKDGIKFLKNNLGININE
jgi:hypothetical protein